MSIEGNILKMKSHYKDAKTPVRYSLPIGDEIVDMNPLIGKKIKLSFEGRINCIATGEQIKKSYNQGYSYKALMALARCDLCIVKPELCHYHKGTCREPKWGEENCMIPHYIYLSISSNLKVGITRHTQIPTRWIDQGAVMALPILKVKNRLTSGLLEKEVATAFSDRTNWRAMLKGEFEEVDLYAKREEIYEDFGDLFDDYDATDVEDEQTDILYPLDVVPPKLKSLSFDKTAVVEGELLGIKGQYLILDCGVLNIRKHQGYFLRLDLDKS